VVHVDGIDGAVILRPIGQNSKILYLQQIGRCIFSLDPNNPIADEDRPIIFDVYNNYLAQNMDREANRTTPTSDLQRLQAIVNWIERHNGYMPNINSENTKEARRAVTLKNIQKKYKRYINGIENKNLSESEIYEIEQILELGKYIELWDLEIPNRIIPPGERDIIRNDTFKVSGTQREFIDLFKTAKGLQKERKLSSSLRIRNTLLIMDVLSEYGIEISNETIDMKTTLGDVLDNLPSEIRREIIEEIDFEHDFKLGEEYNFVKAAFYEGKNIFTQYDIADLRRYGIFESFQDKNSRIRPRSVYNPKTNSYNLRWREKTSITSDGFIKKGPAYFKGLNIRTGTKLSEAGTNIYGFGPDGFYYEYINKQYVNTGRDRDKEGYDINSINEDGFGRDGYYYKKQEDGTFINTGKKYDERHFNKSGYFVFVYNDGSYHVTSDKYDKEGYSKEGYNRRGYDREGYDRNGIDIKGFDRDGYYYEKQRDGTYINTYSYVDSDGYNKYGVNDLGLDREGNYYEKQEDGSYVFIKSLAINALAFDEDGYYYKKQEDGTFINTGLKYNEKGFMANGKHVITGTYCDIRRFTIYGKCWDNNDKRYDKNGFNQDGRYKETGELYHNGYNAFGLDENGKDKDGKIPEEINFTREYVNGLIKGSAQDVLNKYYIRTKSRLKVMIYTATEMYPKLKQAICFQIAKYQTMIKQREEQLKQLESEKTQNKEQIEKLQKECAILRQRIGLMNPMQDIDK